MDFEFNTQGIPEREFALLPDGTYTAYIAESAIEDTRDRAGKTLKLVFVVISEGFNGRKIFARLNVRNKNAEAERIAQQDLRDICAAIGIAGFKNTVELHNKKLNIRVKVRPEELRVKDDPSKGTYDAQNEIKRYMPVDGAQVSAPVSSSPAPTGSAPAAASAPPAAASVPPAARGNATPPWMQARA